MNENTELETGRRNAIMNATIVREILTDGSAVWNVRLREDGAEITIPTYGLREALAITDALAGGADVTIYDQTLETSR